MIGLLSLGIRANGRRLIVAGGGAAAVTVTIAAGKVASDLTNFPVMVDLGALPSAFRSALNTNAGNLRAYQQGATPMPLDVVSWNGTAGFAFVKLPSVLSGSATSFTLKTDGGTTQPGATESHGRNAVWVDYEFVLFGDNASYVDHAGKKTFSLGRETAALQYVTGHPSLFAGNALRVTSGAPELTSAMGKSLASFTLGFSARHHNIDNTYNYMTTSMYDVGNTGSRITTAVRWSGNSSHMWDFTNGWMPAYSPSNFLPTIGQNYRSHVTYTALTSGTRRQLFNGGTHSSSATFTARPHATGFIFGTSTPNHTEVARCDLGFVYFREGVLSDAWIAAEYANVNNPGTFYSVA